MGRIKTTLIKRNVNKLMQMYSDRFKTTFEENKKSVSEVSVISSKKIRNIVAGYITRLMKKKNDLT